MTNEPWTLHARIYGPARPHTFGVLLKWHYNLPRFLFIALRVFIFTWEWELALRKGPKIP